MSKADAATRQTIANLLINRVKLFPTKAVVEGIIPTYPDALVPAQHAAPAKNLSVTKFHKFGRTFRFY